MGRVAQVEVGVEIDDADSWSTLAEKVLGKARPTAEGHFMAAADHQRQMAGVQ